MLTMLMAGMQAYGALQQGQSTSDSMNNQADLALQNADEAERQGQFDANRYSIISHQKIGEMTAGISASGVDIRSGSAQSLLLMSHANSELDRLNILHQADVKSIMYRNQAALDRYGGQSALQGSYWQAAGDVVGGAVRTKAMNTGAMPNTLTDSVSGNSYPNPYKPGMLGADTNFGSGQGG